MEVKKAAKLFKYGKKNKGYWDRFKLYKQVVHKDLSIAEALYPGYSPFFFFDNATNYIVYANNALCTIQISKNSDRK